MQVTVAQASEKVKQFASIGGYLKIRAPNDGILVDKRIRVGDMMSPGMLAMIIVDMEHLEIEAEVSESDLKYVRRDKVIIFDFTRKDKELKYVVICVCVRCLI